jgi:serine/threonine protein kinase/TPR repeat protein
MTRPQLDPPPPAQTPVQTPQDGDVILGKYEITGTLGQGGMGVVYAARHRELGDVAIKFLHPALGARPEVAKRFLQEARAGRRIKSGHVASVFDIDTVDGQPFMVMEHLDGHDLAHELRERGSFPVAQAVDLLLQAGEAVGEAHSRGIVHRDLKPGNLFLTTGADGLPFVKVLDFGISKSEDASMTATAAVVGSPFYMSPEQIMSPGLVDARSDVWSFGVILYELLAGKRPFGGATTTAIHMAILAGTYEDLLELRPELPESLEKVIADALTLDREKRIASVGALAARLAPFGTEAARVSYDRIQRVAARAPSQPPPKVTEAVAPVIRGVETIHASTPVPEDPPRVPDAAPTAKRSRDWKPVAGGAALLAVAIGVVAPRARSFWSPPEQASSTVLAPAAISAAPSAAPEVAAPPSSAAVLAPPPSASAAPTPVVPARAPSATVAASSPVAASSTACAGGASAACEAACTANANGACHELAKALEHGVGATANPARAATLYQAECDHGGTMGCNNLAGLYARGAGVALDNGKAVGLYKSACDAGNGVACSNLGGMHFDGSGVPQNQDLGARLFYRACELGTAQGCLNLSVAYARGHGVPRDASQAFSYAERACSHGLAPACVRVASAKLGGNGVTKDTRGGLGQLDAMCTAHQAAGCAALGGLYARGVGSDVPVDAIRARAYAKKGCDLGDKPSCNALEVTATVDSTDTNAARSNAAFQTQCDAGNLDACASLGKSLMKGNGVHADRAKGAALLERACKGGVQWACVGRDGGRP